MARGTRRTDRSIQKRRLGVALLTSVLLGGILASVPPVAAAFPGANGLIAWQRNDTSGSGIWTMRLDGSNRHELTGPANSNYPAWSPDGTRIAFTSDRDGNAEIYVMDADGGNQTRLTNSGNTDLFPSWSPDGSKILFSSYDTTAGNYDILVMNSNGSNVVNLTNDPAEDLLAKWRPDGDRIAFQSNRLGSAAIYLMDPDGGNLVSLTSTQNTDNYPSWSPDGTKLAFVRSTGDPVTSGLYVGSATGTNQVLISQNSDTMPAWSPEGNQLVVTSHRDFNDELYAMNVDGTHQVRLIDDHAMGATLPEDWFADWQPVAFRLEPSAIAFGDAKVGTVTAAKTVTLRAGADGLSVTSVALSGPNSADFEITSNSCAGAIAALATCSTAIRFVPSATGLRTASLVFAGPQPLGTRTVALSGRSMPFLWGTTRTAGPAYTWNEGRAFAQTVKSTTTYLHGLYATDRVGGKWVTDSGPYAGAYYIRSSNGGTTWSTPKRLNPAGQHGSRVSLASSGGYVYAAWVSTTKWVKFSPTAPRVLYFRRNSDHGASGAWGATIRLTSTSGRIDYPVIAASGSYVFISYTDSATGSIKLAISANRGTTWTTVTVGSTTKSTTSGRFGLPTVAASSSGKYVGVSWLADGSNTAKARVSSTNGASWGGTVTLGTTTYSPSSAASGSRLAFAWLHGRVSVRTWTSGSWSPIRVLPPTDGYSSEVQGWPAIALLGTTHVAVAYSACTVDCTGTNASQTIRSDLVWRASTDNGATWQPSSIVASSAVSSARRSNDAPTILWPSVTRPTLFWEGWTENSLNYRLYLRSGS